MARLTLIQPYDLRPVGDVIEVPGGVAAVLVMRKIGVMEPACEATDSVARAVEVMTPVTPIGPIRSSKRGKRR